MKVYLILGTITLIGIVVFPPIGIIGLIAFLLKGTYNIIKRLIKFTAKTIYEEKEKAHLKYKGQNNRNARAYTQADFDTWKAAKVKAKDQSGFIDLDVLAGLMRSRSV